MTYQEYIWKTYEVENPRGLAQISDSTIGHMHEKRREKLKEDVKRLIKEKSFADQLELFDSLQKLGVAYHFEEEIKYLLNLMKYSEEKLRIEFTEDIHVMALYLRLSRGHGFEVSKDLLVKSYKDEKGCFKPCVFHDIKGLLSLYEASFLSMDGEDEIDEAKEFALKHLNDCMRSNSSTNPVLAKHIALALELPLHHRIQKLQAPMFIEHARNMKELDVDPFLLEFAQLDFNMTQSIYNKEIKEITRWWTKISNLAGDELSFAREWPVESYFLALGLAMEPRFSTCRKEFAKAICFINVVDDIYDIYGSLDELQHFTDAVERWDFATSKSLPEYMKICLSELFSTVNSLACKIMEEKGLDILPYLKRAWLDLCKAYMVEARWYYIGYCPTFEEYLDNAWISVASPLASVMALCLSENLTNLSLESFDFYPSIIRQSSIIFRLYNDLGTSKDSFKLFCSGQVKKRVRTSWSEIDRDPQIFFGDVHEKRREKLKEDVKLLIKVKNFADQLELFDSLQKLGVAYHFEEEIKYLLNLMKFSEEKLRMEFNEDIHVMALYFRLLREHGFEVSKDLLVKSYKDENGCFKPFVFHNIKGILSLYEASFLAMDGEDEIDDAKKFALKLLNDFMRSNLSANPLLAQHIAIALELPLHH
ncbi:hypothetical protein IEQ34_003390 [Dendrobium chrysotoxum]|uniref:Uncharacterized protein n=1 Tax=Dendrobium chrysotoxum TaxID=161865 RepID=A0AAV7HHI4_DENCH|nr:hypothetical protein IEQ34_003390 [Dendrobium chrysotoxum]